MNATKPCKDRFEDIVALVMGELDSPSTHELQEHLALCDRCRAARDVLTEEEKEVRSGFEALARRLGPVEQAALRQQQRQARVRVDVSSNHLLERVKTMILAHKRLSVAAAATAAALAATVIVYLSLLSSPTTAYALEQTVQANNHITSYHAKLPPPWSRMSEVWVQLNADGTPLRARIDYPETEDGAKVVIFSKGRSAVWFKDKKVYSISPEEKALNRIAEMLKVCDPKLAFEELQARKKAGKVKIETTDSANESGFLKLTVTPTDAPDRQIEVYEVNPKTKLAERVTYYGRQGSKWKEVKVVEYLDYNQEIDPKVFQLDLPKNVTIIDQIKRKPGLVKGDLTNEQIAAKVAREFFEALIAKNYEKAGLMYSAIPAEKIKADYERLNVSRIVEMGKPTAGLHPDSTAFAVSVKVMCGPRKWVQDFSPKIRLTDDATATKAVREFFEAMIREDDRAARHAIDAGLFFQGFDRKNSEKIKDLFKRMKFVRIVTIGEPSPCPESDLLEVPVKVDVEAKQGRTKEFTAFVRPAYNQPERWEICGGL
jgi:hypothetical protein